MLASLYSDSPLPSLLLYCDKMIVRHPDSCSGYPVALDESGMVLAVLLLDYPVVPDGSGPVPTNLVLGRVSLGCRFCNLHLKGCGSHNDFESLLI
jgi:hypothetical protein